VATMTFTSSQLVPDPLNVTRGAGTYFTMYPDRNTGAMIEWAWGVSRLIDGLYKTASQNKIDLGRIAVTGCSFQGKMALYAGAFDERIAPFDTTAQRTLKHAEPRAQIETGRRQRHFARATRFGSALSGGADGLVQRHWHPGGSIG